MSVKLLINKSNVPSIKPGTIVTWNPVPETEDFTAATGKIRFDAIVVFGDSVYRNGRKLTLYLAAPFSSLEFSPSNTSARYGDNYERRQF